MKLLKFLLIHLAGSFPKTAIDGNAFDIQPVTDGFQSIPISFEQRRDQRPTTGKDGQPCDERR